MILNFHWSIESPHSTIWSIQSDNQNAFSFPLVNFISNQKLLELLLLNHINQSKNSFIFISQYCQQMGESVFLINQFYQLLAEKVLNFHWSIELANQGNSFTVFLFFDFISQSESLHILTGQQNQSECIFIFIGQFNQPIRYNFFQLLFINTINTLRDFFISIGQIVLVKQKIPKRLLVYWNSTFCIKWQKRTILERAQCRQVASSSIVFDTNYKQYFL